MGLSVARRTALGPAAPTGVEGSNDAAPRLAAALTGICAAGIVLGWLLRDGKAAAAAFAVAYVAGALGPSRAALVLLRQGSLGVDLLMVLAAAGAAYLGDWGEGAVLLFLFSLSNTLEAYALQRTRRSIESLIQLRPREATVVRDGTEQTIAIEALQVGNRVRIRPGERYPVDGEVVDGTTWADEATISGESAPVQKNVGARVLAGTLNGAGSVLVRMTRAVADSTLERIIRMVHEARAEKTATQVFVESWQQPYVLGVLAGAMLTFFAAWLLHVRDWQDAFYHAMVLLVVASPCAVVVGSPAVVLSAIARAAREGVLFKGGYHLEALGRAQALAFDKTGTITIGAPTVTEVWTSAGAAADDMLRLAAAVEHRSEHHLAETVVREAGRRGLSLDDVSEFESHTGMGVHAHVGALWIGVGREPLFETHGVPISSDTLAAAGRFREAGQTALLVVAGARQGVIALADRPRPEAAAALVALRRLGVQRIVLLTGDHERVARAVAAEVGADEVHAGLLPEQKILELRRLMHGGHVVAMIGDGVNDAPALAAASVGIAMGGAGTDVALEVADVVLMRDDLRALPFAVWLSRLARRRVRENLAFAFGVIGLLVTASFLGLPLWLGVIGHEGSTVLVVLNGLRVLWARMSEPKGPYGADGKVARHGLQPRGSM